jgi:hypothetical protein
MDVPDPAVLKARFFVSQLSRLFKHHNPELQWKKDCIPISEVRQHNLYACAIVVIFSSIYHNYTIISRLALKKGTYVVSICTVSVS